MTDLTPNDLSHLSDEEFNALCPQGYHATGPAEPLSPAAQAVKDAVLALYADKNVYKFGWQLDAPTVAAALRAAADQVVPELGRPRTADERTLYHEGRLDAVIRHKQQFLAIAAELEGANG